MFRSIQPHHSDAAENEGYRMDYPDSVEEAAALLGATITRCGSGGVHGRNRPEAILPPLGMHPAFAVVANYHHQNNNNSSNGNGSSSTSNRSPVGGGTPQSELIHRLYILRSLLRTAADANTPLIAAPSILQVLKKLLGISTEIAAAITTPPVISTTTTTTSIPTNTNSSSSGGDGSNTTSATTSVTGTTGEEASKEPPVPKLRKIILHHKYDPPPLWSTPCRMLWVDCVVLCHAMSTTTSSSNNDLTLFVRQMLALASIHPRSVKAGGGVRIAALSVIAALLEYDNIVNPERALESSTSHPWTLTTKLAPWSLDILQVCLKALRSAGNGEPTFREAAIRAAGATAIACRNAAVKSRQSRNDGNHNTTMGPENFCLLGAMEDKAIAEAVKILKQAVTDKFPEVRSGATTLAIALAPILISRHNASSSGSTADPLLALEDVMQLALRNIDDESLVVADGWAEALARCLCTSIQYSDAMKAATQSTTRSNGEGGGDGGGDDGMESSGTNVTTPAPTAVTPRFGTKKLSGLAHTLTTHLKVINYLVEQFVKVGGQLVAAKAGGLYSTGGRAVRLGWSMTLARFLRIQSAMSAIGESRSISLQTVILAILDMVKEQDHHTKGTPTARSTSVSDITLCRLFALRVLRFGLTELASESIQLSMLQELVSLLPTNENTAESSTKSQYPLKENQIHVVLVEVSNLITALGEAAGSRVDELKAALDVCLDCSNSGIRYEASILCVAISSKFPSFGNTLIHDSLEVIQQQLAQIVGAIPTGPGATKERKDPTTFGRGSKLDSSVLIASNESAILGRSLLISMLTKAMPNHTDGLPRSALSDVLKVSEMLIASQFNEILTTSNASIVCSLVRGGFTILSGVLTTGPNAVEAHMGEIVNAWKKAGNAAKNGGKKMNHAQDLSCVEPALTSVVVFLKYCSELLLVIPEALSQVSMFLEDVFPLLQTNGRLANAKHDAHGKILLDNATAALLEAFAWLPSGSFPLVADEVFTFAEEQIRKSVEEGVMCSILDSLIAKQDTMLESKPFCRSGKDSKLFGTRDFEDASRLVSGEVALYNERESVFHLQSDSSVKPIAGSESPFCNSSILEYFTNDKDLDNKPPTPLHEVGTWRRPVDPMFSCRVRLVDAAIQAFSATFGLKDGKEQQGAMNLLEILLPPSLCNFSRAIGISSAPTDEKRSKIKEDTAAAINITAVLLSCLQALPLHEATHNIPIGLGPPWMNKAKVILLTLLPSVSANVRRAAAEGLALLATLGVTEDAHFLQSALLHSLDEIMQSNKPDGKSRTLALDLVSAARAGSLLTLACIQRTASNVAKRKLARARGRLYGTNSDQNIDKSNDNLPVLQMMTRILPSAACHGFKEQFTVKTYALYSFTVLLMYSSRLSAARISEEDKQLLRKGVELVEDNFSASWTAASNDIDRGQEADRLDCEIAFVAVLLRLMTFLLPFLHHVKNEDNGIARRFSVFATLALDNVGYHPFVFVEAMAFYEVSSRYRNIFPQLSQTLRYTENSVVSCLPSIYEAIAPIKPDVFGGNVIKSGHIVSFRKGMKAAFFLLRLLPLRTGIGETWTPMMISSILMTTLEVVCGSRRNEPAFQEISTNRLIKYTLHDDNSLDYDISITLLDLLLLSHTHDTIDRTNEHLLRCILFARQLVVRFSQVDGMENSRVGTREAVVAKTISQTITDSTYVYNVTSTARWQVKCLCMQLAAEALQQLRIAEAINSDSSDERKSSHFDLIAANDLFNGHGKGAGVTSIGQSRLVFHLEDILSSACMSSVATVDQAELRSLQVDSMHFVNFLVECFSKVHDPEEPSKCILYQYSSQILSSVKNALAAPGKMQSKQMSRLFMAGCEVLQCIVKSKLLTDEGVVKRLLSTVIPCEESLPLLSYSDGFSAEYSYSTVGLAVRVMGILTLGNILLDRRMNLDEQFVENVANEIIKDRLCIATYLAASAIDGCRILFSQRLSMVGILIGDDITMPENIRNTGYFYQNVDDIDDLTKSVLTSSCTQCASGSLEVLVEQLNSDSTDDSRREICTTWINALIPLLISGVHSGIEEHKRVPNPSAAVECHASIDPTIVLNDCMYCMGRIFSSHRPVASVEFYDDIDAVINMTCDAILDPIFSDDIARHPFDESSIKEACNMIKMYAQSNLNGQNLTFLKFLLSSLSKSVNNRMFEHDNNVDDVFVTCQLAVNDMILQKQAMINDTVVKSMMHYSMKTLTSKDFANRERLRDGAKVLLKTCLLQQTSCNHDDIEKILCQFASNDLWEEWAMIVGLNDDAYPLQSSIQMLQQLLRNPNQHKSHTVALVGVRLLLQTAMTQSPNRIGQVFYEIGADIINLLYMYGTMKVQSSADVDVILYRTAICADVMKIILLVYRHLSNIESDDDSNMTTFLSVTFEVFLAVIRFNGLPNHPSTEQRHGDPSLGRICAQAILFVARTTPTAFKQCVAILPNDQNERTLLEYAVRAEMNGYVVATPTVEPIKKKLNLKSYQK